jgi:hypothetical protein
MRIMLQDVEAGSYQVGFPLEFLLSDASLEWGGIVSAQSSRKCDDACRTRSQATVAALTLITLNPVTSE